MRNTYLFLFLCILGVTGVFAQHTIQGTVISEADGIPVPGASIIPNDDQSQGTSTDFDGNFTLTVAKASGVISVSYMGFATQRVPYSGDQELTIKLKEEVNALDEVVLIGYGASEKKDLTTAVASVEGLESLSSRPVSNFSEFLQGNLPGVTVTQDGGDPTSSAGIVIRGLGTLSSQTPLTVVDGVPYYGPPINPNDIESVSILKDAASAAIYGAQAAAGVIVIQTKKGKQGKMQVSIDTYAGFQSANNLPTPLNAAQNNEVYNTAADNAGAQRQSAHDPETNPWGTVTRTNWMDEIFRNAALYNLNATISGAGEKSNYMTSFGYNKTDGILVGTSKDRYSFRVKSDYQLSDKITIGENVYYSRTEALGTNTTSGYSGAVINAIYMPAAASVRNEDGTFQGVVPNELSDFAGAYGDVYNPVALLLRPTTSNPVDYMNANVYFDYKITDGLTFRSSYAYATTRTKYKRFEPIIRELGRANSENYLYQSYSDENRWVWDNQISYKKSFGLHHIDLTAIYSAQKTNYEYMMQEGRGFSSEEKYNQFLENATTVRPTVTDVYKDALTSGIVRAMYNYDNTYYLTASIRRDETSRLGRGNQDDYFPSVSGAWRISSMPFFKVKVVNDLKLRASWGEIGNISSVGYYSFDVPLSNSLAVMGEEGNYDSRGFYVKQQSNPDLRWETGESFDLGLDASLFENRLSLTVDYFSKTTKGMILPGLEDAHQGVEAADVNGGEVRNTGWELGLTYTDSAGDLGYTVRGNISAIDNEVLNLDGYNEAGIDYVLHDFNVRSVLRPLRSAVGEELYSYFLVPHEGIFQSREEIEAYTHEGQPIQPNAQPGDLKFRDTNNDGKIDNNDRKFMGSYLPDFTYNFGFTLNYKNFDLNALFQGVAGAKAFNAYKYSTYNASLQGYNLDNRVLGAWSPENPGSDIPRLSTADDNSNFGTMSSWYLENASYLRLKNIALGYTLPGSFMDKVLEGSSLRIYLSADNLFTITDYSGMDPEVGNNGVDVGRYPLSSKYVAGLSFTF
ncbi:SusC/RagA family TonB-linked outer membrane protein [Sinomicrobium weinanense]|uniref:TonB-dependent receptor n=1 Tax=Sinomicrobium weinanense TaxID=2842200 RepID=A0A926Q0F6_9FLAO|nr:TonB-dependent receptor [Sinomicrobium weinanense]MBC9794783.1 TonB-dependent receptor [Sinomicrobium weinanense]MBU3125042.1 TonB-dependent receptor [Sinomicrobium weinanense]